MEVEQPTKAARRHEALPLWAGFALGPIAWAVHLQSVYAASLQACQGDLDLQSMHVISVICLGVALSGALVSLWLWRRERNPQRLRHDAALAMRRQFMSIEGILTGALFALVILAQWIALFYLSPCPS